MNRRIKDLSGQTFGRLTVIAFAGSDNPRRRAMWECLCTCGNTKIAAGYNLTKGLTNSCGCLHSEQLANRNRLKTTHGLWVGYGDSEYSSSDLNRWYVHGISPQEFSARLALQQYKCAICKEVKPLVVDHDHAHCVNRKSCSDCQRGLLCNDCNIGLGAFKDSIANLKQAVEYLGVYVD